jgi:hypothetical protein
MVRTLVLAGLVTLFGAAASEAQYRDSYPPDEQYVSQYDDGRYDDDYDYELLGDPDQYGYNEPDIDVGIFANLGHDGRWHFAANFGWVWRPYAATGWRPYSHGHWAWTSHGWTWVSYEPFGWATYHYGYWAHDPHFGWVWIPGYEWSASRVQWAYYDNYISWAPLAPPGYYCPRPYTTAGISFWFTIGASNFCDPYPYRHCVTPVYHSGWKDRVKYKSPDRHYVERYTGRSIRTTSVEFKHKSWSRGERTTAKFTSKSRGYQPEARAWSQAKSSGRSDTRALKSKSRGTPERQFEARESQRASSSRKAVKPQRVTRESRVARAERPSKQFSSGKSAREQRSIQKPSREQRQSKASFQTARGSDERKSITASGNKSARRDVAAKSKKSGSGKSRGKAR